MRYDSILKNELDMVIIVTGISCSGKTTLAKKLGERYGYNVLSLDDYKVELYEKYGFLNETERCNLWDTARNLFCADIIKRCRGGETFIVEYPFDYTWREFFDYLKEQYETTLFVVNCNSRSFNDIWNSRVLRDGSLNDEVRPLCLTASKYIKDSVYESNEKLNTNYKGKKHAEYMDGKYTCIVGDYVVSDDVLKSELGMV